ncbi:Mis12 protein-domain-containing protein [Mycena pura]|uniref:Mis12 protein-domain-containing protein n=1 Tax=Mycena pura TaxID=153505 RepID=A0AAD6V2J0_9AGAR|nr:Mis12 protein-domain-containing protein [Mycena pura]
MGSANAEGNADAPPVLIPAQILTEALGFSPQLLLDDIINVANDTIQNSVNGVEEFLQQRTEKLGQNDPSQQKEIEQGLVAFQTLLEFHTDVAFDFFEAWSMRNIFAVPTELPLVLPHHKELNLAYTPEEAQELMDEIERLKRSIEAERKLRQQLVRANHRKKAEVRKMHQQLDKLARYDAMDARALPEALLAMHKSVSTLPELNTATISALAQFRLTEAGTRQWEMGKTGYLKWATAQLLAKAKEDGAENLVPDVENMKMFSKASEAMDEVSRSLEAANGDIAMEGT